MPGGPPPWQPKCGISLDLVVEALGRSGRLLSAGPPHPPVAVPAAVPAAVAAPPTAVAAPPTAGVALPAAVLVALFEEEGEARVLLTRRAATLRTHRGQVSFPGGRIEPHEDAVRAALREAFEEIGLDPALARPFALLAPASAFVSSTPITPVVATLADRPQLSVNPAEVARVFDVSLAELAAAFTEEHWSEPGRPAFPMYFFEVAGETVWGATARMLVDLLTVVLAAA